MRTHLHFGLIRASVAACIVACVVPVHAQHPFVRVLDTGDLGTLPSNSGSSWGDYDKDGDLDLFVPTYNAVPNNLFRNDGDGVFRLMDQRDSSRDVGALSTSDTDTPMGVWADIDSDGDLDLYVTVLTDGNWNGSPPAQPDLIYLNDGSARFEVRSPSVFDSPPQYTQCVSLFDDDRDGLLDVLVATWGFSEHAAPNVLYHNEGALDFAQVKTFTPAVEAAVGFWGDVDADGDYDVIVGSGIVASSYIHWNQAAQDEPGTYVAGTSFLNDVTLRDQINDADWGDYDNDGDLDLAVGNFYEKCDLYRNDGHGNYSHIQIPLQVDENAVTVVWVDVDNDGWLDILAETKDPARGSSTAYSYLRNTGGGTFSESVIVSGVPYNVDIHLPNPADFDNDGDMDFFLVVDGDTVEQSTDQLWRNEGNNNHWLKLVLKGTVSNASAIGAIVRVMAKIDGMDTWQMRQLYAGGKYLCQPDPRPNFGLGDAAVAEVVRIEWPSGTVQELTNVAADQILTVVEPPRLKVESGGQLSWPVTADGYRLETAERVDGTWSEASETVEIDGSRKRVTTQTDGETKFYRLNGQ